MRNKLQQKEDNGAEIKLYWRSGAAQVCAPIQNIEIEMRFAADHVEGRFVSDSRIEEFPARGGGNMA